MKYAIVFLLFFIGFYVQAETTFYGSLNLAMEYRDLKDNDQMDDHAQLQDAFSYVGASFEQPIRDGITGFANVETAINIARGQTIESRQTSWGGSGSEQEHIVKLGIKGTKGAFAVGHMWNAYYNAVAVHTDTFSAGWTGFDTYSPFRMDNLITYTSPSYGHFSYAINLQTDVNKGTGKAQDRLLFGMSYEVDQLGLYLGYDNQGAGNSQLVGAAVTFEMASWTLAAKHELLQEGFAGEDGNLSSVQLINSSGDYTYRIHFATGEYPDYLPIDDPDGKASEIKLGIERVLNDQWHVFLEYHQSDEYCAYDVTEGNGNGGYDDAGSDDISGTADDIIGNEIYGCKVLSIGSHFSF